MCFARIFDFLLRSGRGAIQPLATVVTIDSLGLVLVPAFRANQFRYRITAHASESFLGLVEGAFDVFTSLDAADFSPLALAVDGASFLAASW